MHKDPMRKYTIAGVSAFAVGMCSILWQFIIIIAINTEKKPELQECHTAPEEFVSQKTEELVHKSAMDKRDVGNISDAGTRIQSGHR